MYVSFEHTISIGFYELFGCDLYVSFKIIVDYKGDLYVSLFFFF